VRTTLLQVKGLNWSLNSCMYSTKSTFGIGKQSKAQSAARTGQLHPALSRSPTSAPCLHHQLWNASFFFSSCLPDYLLLLLVQPHQIASQQVTGRSLLALSRCTCCVPVDVNSFVVNSRYNATAGRFCCSDALRIFIVYVAPAKDWAQFPGQSYAGWQTCDTTTPGWGLSSKHCVGSTIG